MQRAHRMLLAILLAAAGCRRHPPPIIAVDPTANGACNDTSATVDHCGRCGHACNGGACENGECVARVVSESDYSRRWSDQGDVPRRLLAGAGRLYVERGCGFSCTATFVLDPATTREEIVSRSACVNDCTHVAGESLLMNAALSIAGPPPPMSSSTPPPGAAYGLRARPSSPLTTPSPPRTTPPPLWTPRSLLDDGWIWWIATVKAAPSTFRDQILRQPIDGGPAETLGTLGHTYDRSVGFGRGLFRESGVGLQLVEPGLGVRLLDAEPGTLRCNFAMLLGREGALIARADRVPPIPPVERACEWKQATAFFLAFDGTRVSAPSAPTGPLHWYGLSTDGRTFLAAEHGHNPWSKPPATPTRLHLWSPPAAERVLTIDADAATCVLDRRLYCLRHLAGDGGEEGDVVVEVPRPSPS